MNLHGYTQKNHPRCSLSAHQGACETRREASKNWSPLSWALLLITVVKTSWCLKPFSVASAWPVDTWKTLMPSGTQGPSSSHWQICVGFLWLHNPLRKPTRKRNGRMIQIYCFCGSKSVWIEKSVGLISSCPQKHAKWAFHWEPQYDFIELANKNNTINTEENGIPKIESPQNATAIYSSKNPKQISQHYNCKCDIYHHLASRVELCFLNIWTKTKFPLPSAAL